MGLLMERHSCKPPRVKITNMGGAVGFAALLVLALGCGDSGSDGAGGAGTGGSGSGGAAECAAAEPTEILADVVADHLAISGETLVFIDRTQGEPFPSGAQGGAIRAISTDGQDDRILYTAPADHLLLSIRVTADAVYFLEDTYAGPGSDDVALSHVPLAGGSSVLVGSLDLALDPQGNSLMAIESDAAYVNMGMDGLVRVALPGGAVSTITAEHVLNNADVVGDDIFYSAAPAIGEQILTRISKSATDGTGTPLLDDDCSTGLATSNGIFCKVVDAAQASLVRYELDGSGPTTLVDLGRLQDFPPSVVASDDANVYLAASDLPSLAGHPISRVPAAGGGKTAVACDRHQFTFTMAPYPTNSGRREQFVLGTTDLFWIEQRTESGPIGLYRIAK